VDVVVACVVDVVGAAPEPAHADSTLLTLNEHTNTNTNKTKADFISEFISLDLFLFLLLFKICDEDKSRLRLAFYRKFCLKNSY
jgi:hypothetical protein